MSVHNDVIDTDHRHLICLINSVELALHNNSSAQLENILAQLGDYTDYHFRREEQIQQAIGYPALEEHLNAHTGLLKRFNELRRSVSNLLSPNLDATLRDEVVVLLRDWLMGHILKEDMAMRPFLSERPRDFGR